NRRNSVRELLGISYEVVNVDAASADADYLSIIEVPKYDANHEEFYQNIDNKWVPEIEGKKFAIRKNSNILPRVFWAKNIRSKNQTADILNEFDSAESRDVFINPSQFRDDVEPVGGTVVIEEYKRNYIKAKVLSRNAGYLANTTAYYPGWTVKIDGVSSKPIQTNWFMMGTYVPTGEHIVEFSFFPTGLKIGLLYLFASLSLWLLLSIVKVARVKKYLRRLLKR
ncbi:MAG: YfhO family protein, partial [Candidatus Roizmanbacteria bacterium]|nr:YfhO family protein [Candidatus Roizmanbacteria bacterium]